MDGETMRINSIGWALTVIALCGLAGVVRASTLDDARQNIQQPSSDSHSSSGSSTRRDRPHGHVHVHVEEAAAALAHELCFYIFTSPYWLPYTILEGDQDPTESKQFFTAPYIADGKSYKTKGDQKPGFIPGNALIETG